MKHVIVITLALAAVIGSQAIYALDAPPKVAKLAPSGVDSRSERFTDARLPDLPSETPPKRRSRPEQSSPKGSPASPKVKPEKRSGCDPMDAPVVYRDLSSEDLDSGAEGNVLGLAYIDECRIELDPSLKQDREQHCTFLLHERLHLAGREHNDGTAIMEPVLDDDYVHPSCDNGVNAEAAQAAVKTFEDGSLRFGYGAKYAPADEL